MENRTIQNVQAAPNPKVFAVLGLVVMVGVIAAVLGKLGGEEYYLNRGEALNRYSRGGEVRDVLIYINDGEGNNSYDYYEMKDKDDSFTYHLMQSGPIEYFFEINGQQVSSMRELDGFFGPVDYYASDGLGGFNALYLPNKKEKSTTFDFVYTPLSEDLRFAGVRSFEEMLVDLYIYDEEITNYTAYPMVYSDGVYSVSVKLENNTVEYYLSLNGNIPADMHEWAGQMEPRPEFFVDDGFGGLNALYID